MPRIRTILHYPAESVGDDDKHLKRTLCGNQNAFAVEKEWSDYVNFPSSLARYTSDKSKVTCKRCKIAAGITQRKNTNSNFGNTFTSGQLKVWKRLFDLLLRDHNYMAIVRSKEFRALARKVNYMYSGLEEK